MTVVVTHSKVSGKPAATDPTLIDGPAWDGNHVVTGLATVASTGAASDLTGLAAVATSGSAADLTTGALPAARMPALTGDVTTSAGAVATTIASHAVSHAKMAQVAANTIIGNNTGSTADRSELTVTQVLAMLSLGLGTLGDGSDGAAVFDGAAAVTGFSGPVSSVYTATRETFFTTASISVGVTVKIHTAALNCRGTLTNNGTISGDGASATSSTGATSPTAVGPLPIGSGGGSGGGTNTNGTSGTGTGQCPRGFSTATAAGGTGSAVPGTAGGAGHGGGGGGSLAAGGAGGAVTLALNSPYDIHNMDIATRGYGFGTSGNINPFTGGTGGGGGAGGTDGNGGGGGAAGCWVVVRAFSFAGSGTYTSRGGAGFHGSNGGGGNQFGGGGGGGGAGGIFVIVTAQQSSVPVASVTGGAGGAGGTGSGTGVTGSVGGSGGAGLALIFN